MKLDELKRLVEAATPGPWEFRETKDSGGIRFVVAPNAPRSTDGLEFIPADCSHGYNGRFIAAARNHISKLIAVAEAAKAEHHEKCPGHKNFCRCTTGSILRDAIAALEGDG